MEIKFVFLPYFLIEDYQFEHFKKNNHNHDTEIYLCISNWHLKK